MTAEDPSSNLASTVTRPGSKWDSTPREKRKRKPLSVTLSDAERAMLEAFARDCGKLRLSRVVAAAIYAFAHLSHDERLDACRQALAANRRTSSKPKRAGA